MTKKRRPLCGRVTTPTSLETAGVVRGGVWPIQRRWAIGDIPETAFQVLSSRIPVEALAGAGKKRENVNTRPLLCFWAVTELGMALADLARRLGVAVSPVSLAAQRGSHLGDRGKLAIAAIFNVKK